MNLSDSEKLLLIEAFQHGNIKVDVLDVVLKMKKDKVNEIHRYTITEPKSKASRWQTYVMVDGVRKKVSALTERKLYEKLYEHYYGVEFITVESLYPTWIEKRKSENLSDRTIHRNINYWDKYYKDHNIVKMKIQNITFENIEDFFHEMIKQHEMTLKALNNMKIVLTDIMKMAKRKKIIKSNPFEDVEIKTYACKPPNKKSKQDKIFYPHEKQRMFKALNESILESPEETNAYAVFLLFKLGLRIGEAVALCKSDINYQTMEIHIHRMETSISNEDGDLRPVVVDHTKKKSVYGDRYMKITEYELEIIEQIIHKNEFYGFEDGDYLFCDEDGRTTLRQLAHFIKKMCRRAGIAEKSSHYIRRTVASEMHNNGVPIEIIRGYLGHSSNEVTEGYIYDNNEDDETTRIITTSLEGMNGLKRTQNQNKIKRLNAM